MDDFDRSHRDVLDPFADDDPLAPARGMVFGLLLAAPIWGMLFAIGWAVAGLRWP